MRRIAIAAVLAAAVAALVASSPARGAASPWAINGPSRLRLVSPYGAAPAAGDMRLGVEFRTAPGWHVYWKNSGDAGYAPKIVWRGDGLAAGSPPELLWPAPHRFELAGGLLAFGYEGEVIYPVRAPVQVKFDAGGRGVIHLTADVDYLVCQVDCIPFRSQLTLDQPVAAVPVTDLATAAAIDEAWRQLPIALSAAAARGISTALRYDAGSPALELTIRGATAAPGADLFFASQELFELARPRLLPLAGGVRFRVLVARRQVNRPLPASAAFAWTATGLLEPKGSQEPLALEGASEVALAPPPAAPDRAPRPASIAALAALAALSAMALLVALGLWGMLAAPGAGGAAPSRGPELREGLGFLAFAGALGLLYRLSREVRPEGLAAVELTLLALAFLAWARRSTRRVKLRWLLGAAILACSLAAPFVATATLQ